jgi:hypothetical protein
MEEQVITGREIGRAAQRALEYQRYLFRRAYGVYYAVWAAALFLLIPPAPLGTFLGLTGALSSVITVAMDLVILVGAAFATARIFRNVHRSLELRRTLEPGQRGGRPKYFGAWLGLTYAIVIAADVFLPTHAQAILFAALIPVPFVIFYLLGLAFPGKRPIEGVLAVSAYGASAAISLVLSIVGAYPWLPPLAWSVTVAVWLFAAIFSLLRAPDELEALRG